MAPLDRTEHTQGNITLVSTIHHDEDCNSPWDGDEGLKIVLLHRHYTDPSKGECGKEADSVGEWIEANKADWFVAPLFMFEHGGVALSTGDFGDRWDSGQVGIVALKRSEWGNGKEPDAKLAKYADDVARGHGQWMNGECYGYRIATEDGEELDSCWGFIGFDTVQDEIKGSLPHCFKQGRRDSRRRA